MRDRTLPAKDGLACTNRRASPALFRALMSAVAPLLLAACHGGEPRADPSVAAAVAPVPSLATGDDPAATQGPAGVGSDGTGPDLSIYVGRGALEKVGHHAFLDDPVVVAGVAAAVTDPEAAATIAAIKGPSGPVLREGGEIAASRCASGACSVRNYAVHVDPASNAVSSVCFYDETVGPIATWYRPDGTKTSEGDGCTIG